MAQAPPKLNIPDTSLASAFFAGFGRSARIFGESVAKWVESAINVSAQAIGNALRRAADAVGNAVNQAREFVGRLQLPGGVGFGEWLRDDPLGAVAGAGAVLLTAGVVVAAGAAAAGLGSAVAGAAATGGAVGGVKALIGGIAGMIGLKGLLVGVLTAPIVGRLGQWFINTAQFIWHFNWQVSDAEIQNTINGNITALYAVAGGSLGGVLGSWGCGSLTGKALVKLNPRMLLHMKTAVEPEIYEECLGYIRAAIFGSADLLKHNYMLSTFRSWRHWVKGVVKNAHWVQGILGEERTRIIENWGNPQNEPWTFAEDFERKIESIPNRNWRAFTENFFEELFESCGEAILTVTGGWDSAYY